MELMTRMVEHHVWLLGEMVNRAHELPDDVLQGADRALGRGDRLRPDPPLLLARLVGQLAMWVAAVNGQPYDFAVEKGRCRTIGEHLAGAGPAFLAQVRRWSSRPTRRDVRRRGLRPARGLYLRRHDRARADVRRRPAHARDRRVRYGRSQRYRLGRPNALRRRGGLARRIFGPRAQTRPPGPHDTQTLIRGRDRRPRRCASRGRRRKRRSSPGGIAAVRRGRHCRDSRPRWRRCGSARPSECRGH